MVPPPPPSPPPPSTTPPPPSTTPPPSTPPPLFFTPPLTPRQPTPSPLKHLLTSRQIRNQNILPLQVPNRSKIEPRSYVKLDPPRPTNIWVWCVGSICLIFSVILILFGVATLIIFLGIKPKSPLFDTSSATLSFVYINSPEFFNGDLTFVANFSNPNKRLNVRFEYLDIKLYFSNRLIAAQLIQPFEQRRGETKLVQVHMISSLVYLPPNLALHLQKQVQDNRVVYQLNGTFRIKAKLGLLHFSYWLHSTCQLALTSPPIGVLVARSCKTKRS